MPELCKQRLVPLVVDRGIAHELLSKFIVFRCVNSLHHSDVCYPSINLITFISVYVEWAGIMSR